MRITDLPRTAAAGPGAGPRRTGAKAERFSLDDGPARDAAPLRTAAPIGGIDALVALQTVDDAESRLQQAVAQGHELLDLLDDLKLAMLDGGASPARLDRLRQAVEWQRPDEPDPRLDRVLTEIDLRARVELAKLRNRRAA